MTRDARIPLIGVCGPVGAGKSTVLDALAAALGFKAWPERVADNPFFARYLHDRRSWAFPTQVAFLLAASRDAAAARREPVGGVIERPAQEMLGVFVRDLHDRALLDDDEQCLLADIARLGEAAAGGPPDLLVVLHGDPETLLGRIRARRTVDRDAYDLADMRRLAALYDLWTAEWDLCPILPVNVEHHDLRCTEEIAALAAAVRAGLPEECRYDVGFS